MKKNPETGTWGFTGAELPLPATLTMGIVPRGGWSRTGSSAPDSGTTELLDEFNHVYSTVLRLLEEAWRQDLPDDADRLLPDAVVQKFSLQGQAQRLMRRALPDGSGKTYGPEFRYVTP
ncbi:hypothetical protein ABZX98_15505 [Streptomyces sp. NPDC002992]|uniref:hypothetical protein n=1 Tax=Streptomyces sp. NPDC002992 TaxID=3154273 RepID=UPI0033B29CE7